jgi:hypothetical protein
MQANCRIGYLKQKKYFCNNKSICMSAIEFIATKQDISEAKVDLIKWMVGFWITQMAAIVGLYVVVINSLSHIH